MKDNIFSIADKTGILETYKVVCLSTAHLTKTDSNFLSKALYSCILTRSYGHFIKLCPAESEYNYKNEYSDTLKQIIKQAIEYGAEMIEFDCDAEIIPNFPTFDW